jgi:preprotein translocase subunit SecD
MNKNLGWKLGIIIATLLVFLFGIFGVPDSWSRSGLLAAMQKRIHLGLDLKGGTHLILQVEVDDAVNADSDRAVDMLKEQLRIRKINYTDVSKPDPENAPDKIVIKGVPSESIGDLRSLLGDRLPTYDAASGTDNSFTLTMKPASLVDLKTRAVQQAIETISNRINTLGVSEPTVEEHGLGAYQILVQLPGVDDPARVKIILSSTAMLEIKQVKDGPFPSEQAALAKTNGLIPSDSMLLKGRGEGSKDTDEAGDQYWILARSPAVSGGDLRSGGATVERDTNTNAPEVGFALTNEGGRKFAKFTGEHVGERLAVVLDGRVREVANIHEQIHDTGRISGGGMTEEAAKDLTLILNSGALPARIKYLQELTVGPSLGTESIHAGVDAAIVGMAAVLIFMLVYYHGAGINADIALILNLVILLGFMGYFGAVLTLPGIAGVILTVGMGVDSNVLIFERIREELRNGKTPPSAVDQGFGHAWITIVDTHVTTLVSAAILFMAGSGPVKGFAVTLTIGLLANLFTAVFVSRVIFDWILSRKQRGEALSI